MHRSGRGDELEVTPLSLYLRRREFLTLGAGSALSVTALARAARAADALPPLLPGVRKGSFATDEKQTPYEDVTTYNNYYEFGTDKDDPAANAGGFRTRPWKVSFEGEIEHPQTVAIDELLGWFPLEERVYRMRCVEAWSMVIPWIGLPARRPREAARRRRRRPGTSSSRHSSIPRRCRASAATCSPGRTSRACGSTRRCTR